MPIFDSWEDLKDCDDCERYYNSQCDGVAVDQKRNCTQYVATRRASFEGNLNKLERQMKGLKRDIIIVNVCVFALLMIRLIQLVT